jgi:hypothetical protein
MPESVPMHPMLDYSNGGVVMGIQHRDKITTVISDGRSICQIHPYDQKPDLYSQAPQVYNVLSNRWPKDHFLTTIKDPQSAPSWAETYAGVLALVRAWTVPKDDRERHLVAAWTLATYSQRLFSAFPRLNFHGEKATGKSKALKTISHIAFNGLFWIAPTAATLFRFIDALRPTLCIDEVESLDERSAMMQILNNGYLKGATVPRVGKTKDGNFGRMDLFEVYSPIAFGGIHGLPSILEDRTITINMVKSHDLAAINRPQPSESEEFAQARAGCYATSLLRFHDVLGAQLDPEPWLSGRRLELYGPLLRLASLASSEAFDAIYSLAKDDVEHCSTISEDGAELIRHLLMFTRGVLSTGIKTTAGKILYPQEIAGAMSRPEERKYVTAKDVGLLLRRYGFAPMKRKERGQPYLITRERAEQLAGAYSTHVCHPIHGKVATQSTCSLPPSPRERCHVDHGKVATSSRPSLPPSERRDAGLAIVILRPLLLSILPLVSAWIRPAR